MAQTRKQQSEIDRVLKRVQDGLIEFESIWQKVYSAPTAALKEKHEADLKKEIKRLQRYRDQIKTWLSSPEIRDKNEMLQARKQIERDMERFKVCEKETKTKAFSKEALTNTPKKKLLDKPKLEVKSWIDKRITLLKNQLGERESQLDAEQRKGKKRNKGQEEAHIDHLQRLVERYKFHIEHLEMAWEMLFEDEIVVADVEEIQEDVDYFIENNQDEDMEDFDDAYMYDLLASKRNAKPPPPPSAVLVAEDENLSDIELSDDDYDSMADDADDKEPEPPVAESPPPPPPPEPIPDDTPRRAPPKKVPAPAPSPPQAADLPPKDRRKEKTAPLEKATAAEPAAPPPPKPTPTKAERETPKKASKKKKPAVVPVQVSANYQEPSPQSAASSSRVPSVVALASSSPKLSPRALALVHRPPPELPAASAAVAAQVPTPAPFANIVKAQQQKQAEAALARAQAESVSKQIPPSNQADHPDEAPKSNGDEAVVVAVQSLQVGGKPETTAPAPPGLRSSSPFPTGPPPGLPGPSKNTLATKLKQKQHQAAAAAEEPAADPSLLRPSRLAAVHAVTQRDASPGLKQPHLFDAPLSDEQQRNLDVLDASLRHMPTPADSDRPKQYLPRNPYHTPASWPSTPSPIFEDPTFFAKYDTDTLFFIFYFQQGTYQQYLAASQLKKQSWRYHTKYLTWFQRHKDPQVTTDEFEQGTYVYFDYDHSWCQRIKSEFTFEYRYLEDDL